MEPISAILPGNGHAWNEDTRDLLRQMIHKSRPASRGRGNPGRRKEKQTIYHDVLSAFDIETTALQDIEQSFMYVWQWCFVSLTDDAILTVYGRTWEQWQDCARTVCDELSEDHAIVVLDHNLSYEFHFIRAFVPFRPEDVFATDVREIVKCTAWGKLEFRCTMRHSNTSLSHYLKQWHVAHQKLDGDEYDYTKIRYPWTELTEKELAYALHDVIGLVEAYRAEMEYWHDTLYTVPLTSTGYVRRICKKAWANINFYDRLSWMPNLDLLDELHLAFRGGDTHASRFHGTPADADGAVINYGVQSWDRSSSYPDVLVNCNYPIGDWYRLRNGREWIEPAEVEKYIHKYGKAILGRVHFMGLSLIDESWEMPYIPKSKALYFENIEEDNGRVLAAKFLSIVITDVDWEIISREYTWKKCYFSEVYYCRYRRLSPFFLDVVRGFYADKTRLKGADEGSQEEVEYVLKKQLLNALYGMAAQWPIKLSEYYVNGKWVDEINFRIMKKEEEEDRKLLETERGIMQHQIRREKWESYKKKAFLPYQVGVWCTAWARLELHRAMWYVRDHGGRVIYVDTDSVKYVLEPGVASIDMKPLNDFFEKRSRANGAYADSRTGKRYYMGVYDYEYTADFATMGAKKYCYRKDGETQIHVTIAGVNKKRGAQELTEKGGFSAFRAGTRFTQAGGVRGIYNDGDYGDIDADGHTLHIGPNVCLLPDTYTLSLTNDYARLLDSIATRGKLDAWTATGVTE